MLGDMTLYDFVMTIVHHRYQQPSSDKKGMVLRMCRIAFVATYIGVIPHHDLWHICGEETPFAAAV